MCDTLLRIKAFEHQDLIITLLTHIVPLHACAFQEKHGVACKSTSHAFRLDKIGL